MKKKITTKLLSQILEDKGLTVLHETTYEDQLTKVLEEYGAEIDMVYPPGDYDALFYSETTTDGYEVYVATDDANSSPLINEDIYYYESDWFEKIKDFITDGYIIYIEAEYIENYALQEIIGEMYTEIYEEEYEKTKDVLLDEGYTE
tara:strand:+ start:49 stop:489 length:441 start_codon:yes stop_codon:yes gene_type:complete